MAIIRDFETYQQSNRQSVIGVNVHSLFHQCFLSLDKYLTQLFQGLINLSVFIKEFSDSSSWLMILYMRFIRSASYASTPTCG